VFPLARPSNFGLTGIADDWSNAGGRYGSIAWKKNIDWTCVGPALITAVDNPTQPVPGLYSAPPRNGFYSVQLRVVAGSQPQYTMWVNNSNELQPSVSQLEPFRESLTTSGWERGAAVGSYNDVAPPRDVSYTIDAFEMGETFRRDW
jgi:hypothetical protein